MIRFDRVSKRYEQGFEALKQVDLHLYPGEMAFVTGHSGAGKSTLLKLLMAMERPTSGQLLINGRSINHLDRKQIPEYRRRLGVVFQNHDLLFDRTVYDNVALPLLVSGFPQEEIPKRVRAALEAVQLGSRLNAFPIALSTGEQQRVGIARAVVHRPKILLADEPTGNLDPELSREIMDVFRRFNDVGVTVLVATHDIELIRTLNYRIIRLKQGMVVDDGVRPI